ncbi:methyltransferase domain-containing protein [Rhodocaloribacter litoris]|uniref:tRNA (mnm(5)s(2)U34)-methyltransferase n=1 Tax=Rhodocaloribacter litoris TaxID=2558931 RepID=UPI0014229D86|nr:class I SAM-dependent methyltransferase [Rhodocaloribacter litoris]QXD15564.1 methyltransferase domain-containing protein [Rhodocaloribacter litoris]
MLIKPLDRAKEIVAAVLTPGDVAVDATTGNGHDTVFLAERVGPAGHVYGFDVQEEAIGRTRQRLAGAGLAERVTLFARGHEALRETLPAGVHGHVAAVMFNLGYLPGGDHRRITRPETTVPALDAALDVLRPGGVLTVVVYPGHPGGAEEAGAVRNWAAALDPHRYLAVRYDLLNRPHHPPWLLAVEKRD